MRDYAFYNAGCSGSRGPLRALVPVRRLLRRVLRPLFFRLEELLRALDADGAALAGRQDELEAMIRRLEQANQERRAEAERLDRHILGLEARLAEEFPHHRDEVASRIAEAMTTLSRRLEDAETACSGHVDRLESRQDELDRQIRAETAFAWDYVALARRLAALEDHVEGLLRRAEDPDSSADRRPLTIRFVPGTDGVAVPEDDGTDIGPKFVAGP